MKLKILFQKLRITSLFLFLFCVNAAYSQTYPIWENGGYGLIDGTGKVIFATNGTDSTDVKQPIIIFTDPAKGKYGLTTKENKIILPPVYDYISREKNGFILKQNDNSGFADTSGKIILEPKYHSISVSKFNTLIVYRDSVCSIV